MAVPGVELLSCGDTIQCFKLPGNDLPPNFCLCFLFAYFVIGSLVQDDLELWILRPLSTKCWHYRPTPSGSPNLSQFSLCDCRTSRTHQRGLKLACNSETMAASLGHLARPFVS